MKAGVWIALGGIAFGKMATGQTLPSANQEAQAVKAYQALVKRLRSIKALTMYVVNGNFEGGGSRTVHFPPPRHPKNDDPRTIFACFSLPTDFNKVRHGKFRGQKVTILEHIPGDGGDGYGVMYVSVRTGWPLAAGWSADRDKPQLTEFKHLRLKLNRP